MNERGAWKIDANGGFANFTEGDSYDTAAMDSLGQPDTRLNGPDARTALQARANSSASSADGKAAPAARAGTEHRDLRKEPSP